VNKQLKEVDMMFMQIQDYIDPTPDYLSKLTQDKWMELQKDRSNYTDIYNSGLEKLRLVLPTLSNNEIVEGYTEGCRLLQRGLSGYMADHFQQEYIPTMIGAIKQPHLHTGWIFLQALANNLGKDVAPLAIEALSIEGLTETALNVVKELNIIEALPKVRQLINGDNTTIAFLAEKTSNYLEGQL
jgi:hypothetical protein